MHELNHKVETDLIFWRDYIIMHFVDRATRWQAAVLVESKNATALIAGLDKAWVKIFGPMRELIMDGETAFASEECAVYLNRHGIKRKPRAPGQHAQYAERRGGLLKEQLNRSASQLRSEGYKIGELAGQMPMDSLLAECVFAGNALLSYHGHSPYEAVFGRTPSLLPDATLSVDEPTGTLALGSREHHRMREIAVNSIVESSAQDRINRALNTPSRAPAGACAYNPGDSVDIFRHGLGEKHVSGWLGPATIVDCSELTHGQATVKWQGRHISVRLQDLRPHLALFIFLLAKIGTLHIGKGRALDLIHDTLEQLASANNHTIVIAHSKQRPDLFAAACWVAQNGCGISRVDVVRLAVGAARLPAMSGTSYSLTLWYFHDHSDLVYTVESSNGFVNLRHEVGDQYERVRIVQFITSSDMNDWQHHQQEQRHLREHAEVDRQLPRASSATPDDHHTRSDDGPLTLII